MLTIYRKILRSQSTLLQDDNGRNIVASNILSVAKDTLRFLGKESAFCVFQTIARFSLHSAAVILPRTAEKGGEWGGAEQGD